MNGFAERPDYIIDVRRKRNRITVHVGDLTIADTTSALLVDEQDHGIVFYLPRADVRTGLLAPHPASSTCPFKGRATYWRLAAAPEGDPIAWEYPDPTPEVALIKDHIAFYQDRVRLVVGIADPAVSGR